jgi:hypothetical protein
MPRSEAHRQAKRWIKKRDKEKGVNELRKKKERLISLAGICCLKVAGKPQILLH